MRTPEFQPLAFQRLEKQKFLAKLIPFLSRHLEGKNDQEIQAALRSLEDERLKTAETLSEIRQEVNELLTEITNDLGSLLGGNQGNSQLH